ncbi:MAG: helix-turn-helix transcriptional regulator [Candidatus Galacturonibacter soehngenii]|nr:helix-turn-helix transcriptional regulator [Candidatus Galacturonibacter soehngenii]
MGHLDKNIAINLKRIRKSKNMSLDMLAKQTGVSKSMLGQIERGESNPTVTIIGKIVEGIRVSFEELIQTPVQQVKIVEKDELTKTYDVENNCRVYTYFPYDERRNFEIYLIEIEPGGEYKTIRGENTFEYVTVTSGELVLNINEKEYMVKENNSIQLAANQEHCYRNNGEKILCLYVVLCWDKAGLTKVNHYIGA